MSIINLSNVAHDYGNKLLFEDVNLSFDRQSKAGLIGRNGTGKSTLFKIISGQISPYRGQVHIAKDKSSYGSNASKFTSIGYFTQDYDFHSSARLWDWLYMAREDLIQKKNELNNLTKELEITHNDKLLSKLDTLQTEYEILGGFTYENEIKSLLLTFGFTEEDYQKKIDDFSGGEKTRIRLVSILLNKFEFILFDEPTNHLDISTVDWFIQYLKNLECGYLIVSHDRYLLDQTVNVIYELRNQKINSYSGNFSAYLLQAEEREKVLQKQFKQQQKFIEKTEDFIRKNMAGQKVNQAKSRLKMLNRMDKIELEAKDKNFKLNFSTDQRSGNDIYRLKDLCIGYENKILVKNININLHYKDKICLIGANGTGKTTLLKILNGEMQQISGDLWTGYNLSVGYYDQTHFNLDLSLSVIDTIWELVPYETYGYVMSYLAKFGFYEDSIDQKVSSLSGGEKSRLYLARLIHENPNLLILDEPTNHLDLSMIQSLENALKNYDGTIILVSHDRYFIQAITNKYWILQDCELSQYQGNLETLLEQNQNRILEKTNENKSIVNTRSNQNEKKTKKPNQYLVNKLLSQIDEYDSLIKENQNKVSEVHNLFANPDFYSNQDNVVNAKNKIQELNNKINEYTSKKDELETEYLILTDEECL